MFTHTSRTTHRITVAASASALALTLLLSGCSARTLAAGGGSEPAPAPSSAAPAEPQVPGLNTPVAVGAFSFTALAAKAAGTTVGSAPLSATAQGMFFQVDLKITNTGNSAQTFLVNYVKVKDADGKTYDADSSATLYASGDTNAWIATINPGNSVQGPILFDLPAGVKPVTLLVSDDAFSAGKPIRIG